jgi:hypothetical protein
MPRYIPTYYGIDIQGKLTIYLAGPQPSREVMLYSHGCHETGKSQTTQVPNYMSVYFYSEHGQSTSNAQGRAVIEGTAAVPNTIDRFAVDEDGKKVMKSLLQWDPASARSIAGPGSTIWDYRLTWNEKVADILAAMWRGTLTRDLVVLNNRTKVLGKGQVPIHMSKVFDLLSMPAAGWVGHRYEKLHYTSCRTPDKGLDYCPLRLREMLMPNKACS